MESIAERLCCLMKRKNIKAVELAQAVAVNTSTISRILKGTQMPASDTLYKFAQYFNVTMEYLQTGKNPVQENCVSADFSPEEALLLEYYHIMSTEDQEELMMIARMKASKRTRGPA